MRFKHRDCGNCGLFSSAAALLDNLANADAREESRSRRPLGAPRRSMTFLRRSAVSGIRARIHARTSNRSFDTLFLLQAGRAGSSPRVRLLRLLRRRPDLATRVTGENCQQRTAGKIVLCWLKASIKSVRVAGMDPRCARGVVKTRVALGEVTICRRNASFDTPRGVIGCGCRERADRRQVFSAGPAGASDGRKLALLARGLLLLAIVPPAPDWPRAATHRPRP